MKRLLLLSAVALVSCSKTDRPHARVAEVTSPVHVTVRTIDFPDRTGCNVAGGPLDRLKCWVSPSRTGATYVEVGGAADTPLVTTGKVDDDLDALLGRANTYTLMSRPVKKVKLVLDPLSLGRVVVDCGDIGVVLFLNGDTLVDTRFVWDEAALAPRLPTRDIDWARVPKPPEPPLDLVKTTREQLDALAKSPEGLLRIEDAVSQWMNAEGDLEDAVFTHAWSVLPADTQTELELQLTQSVVEGSQSAVRWFEKHPARQTPAYTDALLRSLEYRAWESNDVLRAIVRLKPPHFVERACELVEEAYFAEDEFDPSLTENAYSALALLVHEKAKCPWVVPLLERVACNVSLACLPPEENFAPVDDEGRPRAAKGLCTAKERKAALDQLFTEQPASEEEDDGVYDAPTELWAPLLLLSAEQQGPLPADVVRRTARRSYLPVFTPVVEEGLPIDGCRDLFDLNPSTWACQLPLSVTTSTREGCRMEVDDTKKTLTLTTVPAPP